MVDPLDGTTNFIHRQPNVCVSIGLTVGKQVGSLSQTANLRSFLVGFTTPSITNP